MSSDNLNSDDHKTDPLSSAAKHMDERLRGANQGALLSAQSGVGLMDSSADTITPQPYSVTDAPTIPVPTDLKAFLTMLAIPIGISLFAGLSRGHDD